MAPVPQRARRGTIITAKCALPPVTDRLVERRRLDRLIRSLVDDHQVVTVCATAGSGKTTAVVEAVGRCGLPVAWLTVDETDRAPGRLLTYLEASLAIHVPAADGVATRALRQHVAHREAAGLLSEAVGTTSVLLVLDELERLGSSPGALAVLSSLLRYRPPSLRVILVSREELAIDLGPGAAFGQAVALGDADLAFTVKEAATALAQAPDPGIDPVAAVEATGGWVAGILFEAWRSAEHVVGIGGEADPLHGYLASQVLDALGDDERELLVSTSLLTEVTAGSARALGQERALAVLAKLRNRHLPATFDAGGTTMRCHPRFREYLLTLLERRGPSEVAELRRASGDRLAGEGHFEDAVEEYLLAGAPELALAAADGALEAVVERLDFPVAERWLRALRPVAMPGNETLARTELMLAIAQERYGEGARIADRLAAAGELEPLVHGSFQAATMLAWCYWHVGRLEAARAVVAAAEAAGHERVDVLYDMFSLVDDAEKVPGPGPALTGGPLDALIMRVRYARGKLRELDAFPASPWAAAVSAPWRIGTLRALGRTEQALELYSSGGLSDGAPVWYHAMVEPELLLDLGRLEEARAALDRGRVLIDRSESIAFAVLGGLIEVKLELRLANDGARAASLLAALAARPESKRFGFLVEEIATWIGMLLLRRGESRAAVRVLRDAVATMVRNERILELPTAGVLLAEAEWRLGHKAAASRAAEIARAAARRQGSDHVLLQALADFPSVLARQVEVERAAVAGTGDWAERPWAALAEALASSTANAAKAGRNSAASRSVRIRVCDLGPTRIEVEGAEVRPRIRKSCELLAYLAGRGAVAVERDELLGALFEGRADTSARSYLRQAVYRLREVLPAGAGPRFQGSRLCLGEHVVLDSACARAEAALEESAGADEPDRLDRLVAAIAGLEAGEYLAGVRSTWVEDRRARIAEELVSARHEAASLALLTGNLVEAKRLATAVLERDPFREATWRLLMRAAKAAGDEDGVLLTYRRCKEILNELGAAPGPSTRSLLASLRR